MQYMVILNGRLMIPVNAYSHEDAEHIVLSTGSHGIHTAIAFDPATQSCEYAWAYGQCEIMSFNEFVKKTFQQRAWALETHNVLLDEQERCDHNVSVIEEQLKLARAEAAKAHAAVQTFSSKYGFPCVHAEQEHIDQLRQFASLCV